MLCNKIEKSDLPLFLAVAKNRVAEEKHDGVRVRLKVKDGKLTLFGRNRKDKALMGADVTYKYPEFNDFNVSNDMELDGEMCVLNCQTGTSEFNAGITFRSQLKSLDKIQAGMTSYPVSYKVFDVLEFKGTCLRDLPWTERRAILDSLDLKHKNIEVVTYHTDIATLWTEVLGRGGEGIIVKKTDAPYLEGKRNQNWIKVKDNRFTDVRFTKLERNPAGIRISNENEIAIQVSGRHAPPVERALTEQGEVLVTVKHLGAITPAGKYRTPTFKGIANRGN